MDANQAPLLAGIEAGGTKYVCAVGHQPDELLRETRFPTTSPEETIAQAVEFFREAAAEFGPLRAMGVGTFGPADINPRSPGYGGILTTPKEGWAGFNLVNALREGLGEPVPIAIDTDVNAAAVGEAGVRRRAQRAQRRLRDRRDRHRRRHPDRRPAAPRPPAPRDRPPAGARLRSNPDKATSVCPFHDRCLEGRASGPAIEKRWGKPADRASRGPPGMATRGPLPRRRRDQPHRRLVARPDHPRRRRDAAGRT